MVVQPGGALIASNTQIQGSLQTNGAAGIQVSGSSFAHGLSIQNGTGPVSLCGVMTTDGDANLRGNSAGLTIGDPNNGCDGNTVKSLHLTANTNQVTVNGNTITGDMTIEQTVGSVTASGNHISDNASFNNNVGQTAVSGNTVGHDLNCGGSTASVQASDNTVINHNSCGG